MHVENPQNEKGGLYTYKTPKSKKAVYTRIKHQNRKRKLFTYTVPKFSHVEES
jgi:hypothetical protein